ncbi:LOW QUALITY PROTEIN: tyrosine-protein phosphatase 99A-like [Liolophura sinensis]|uniref:LOW QUALITY PROTEIN: tyrosine-protein phosphatase 99A-like n=1 Tax=Liolophura sinensis TaxID=3198878 RepID=UPI003158AF0E
MFAVVPPLLRLLPTIVISVVYVSAGAEPVKIIGKAEGSVFIPCRVMTNNKSGGIMWYKDGAFMVSFTPSTKKKAFADQTLSLRLSIDTAGLNLTDLAINDSGNYTCKVVMPVLKPDDRSILEENSTKILLVQDVPAAPDKPNITDIKSRSMVVTWSLDINDNNSPITTFFIQIRSNGSPSWSDGRQLMVPKGTSRLTIRELFPYTRYQVRVSARNIVGKGPPSEPTDYTYTKSEKPGAAPQITDIKSPTNSTIELVWKPLKPENVNGVLKSYQIVYGILGAKEVQVNTIQDPNQTSAVITDLKPYTDYQIQLSAQNDMGESPSSRAILKTAEGIPGKPRITHVSERTPNSFLIHWEPPDVLNGKLRGYELRWIQNGTTLNRLLTGALTNPMLARIDDLEPYTQYQIKVAASTVAGRGEYSDMYPALTDVDEPSAPRISNVTVLSPKSVFIQWERPQIVYKQIDKYVIEYKAEGDKRYNPRHTSDGFVTEHILQDLQTNRKYEVTVSGITNSIFSKTLYLGKASQPVCVKLTDPDMVSSKKDTNITAGIVAGLVAPGVVLIVVVALIGKRTLLCRRFYRAAYYHPGEANAKQTTPSTIVTVDETYEEADYPDIKVECFAEHVEKMHADSGIGYAQEFEDINKHTRVDLKSENSALPENKLKNRYINIAAFDHTRVILKPNPGRAKHSDYINANYIDGYEKPKAYIAAQGPLQQTFADFWRMVWEQHSLVIIMITNLMERGRRKCDQYWPTEGVEMYGTMSVKLLNAYSRAHYTVRIFSLRNLRIKKKHSAERVVYQYHYTEWPDHGVPDFTLPVLKFVRKSAQSNPEHSGPMVIHCSAGVGRTGTYILIDSMMAQIKDKGTVNVPNFLLHIRQQRNYLVQTEDQYTFIHDVLLEYIHNGGDTEIVTHNLSHFVENLDQKNEKGEVTLDKQYKLVTAFKAKEFDYSVALEPFNHDKNRNKDFLPVNLKRVPLPIKAGVEGSDYINASYLQGFHKTDEFIITQHPMSSTVNDFWRMVWDQNSSAIVLLSLVDAEEYKKFWPDKETPLEGDTGHFKVTLREENHLLNYVTRDFILESTQDDYVLMTRVFSTSYWPESCTPLHMAFEFIRTVRDWYTENDTGPVTVIDRFGGVQAGTFCALWTLFDQMTNDASVDVYQLAKLYHLKRPGVVGTREDYFFLYKAIDALYQDIMEKESQSGIRHLGVSGRGNQDRDYHSLGSRHQPIRNGSLPRSRSHMAKMETKI